MTSKYPDANFFIACDNCRNPCCVDLTAAAHIQADAILKLGRSCRSEHLRIGKDPKVCYECAVASLDVDNVITEICRVAEETKESCSGGIIVRIKSQSIGIH